MAVLGIVWVVTLLTHSVFLKGLIWGGALTATPLLLWSLVVSASGTAHTQMGEVGEQWTAQELRKLRRRGWLVVNHVMLRQWDIDHVLVGPGGVLAVETKWSSERWLSRPYVRGALERTSASARDLRLWLKSSGVNHVLPVVVLWGSENRDVDPRSVDDVIVTAGRQVASWVEQLPVDRLTEGQVDAVWRKLDVHCRSRDVVEDAEQPMPASLQEYLVDLGLAVAVGVACLFLAGLVAHVLPPLLSWLAFGVPAVAALLLDRGGRRSKTMAGGSLLCLWLVLALVIRALVAG